MTDATHLSGPMLDYYAALAENMPNPRLRKHEREDTFICVISIKAPNGKYYSIDAYSPTTNPALALPIIEKLVDNLGVRNNQITLYKIGICYMFSDKDLNSNESLRISCGGTLAEAALRALVAWKFPNGLPDPVYEKEEK